MWQVSTSGAGDLKSGTGCGGHHTNILVFDGHFSAWGSAWATLDPLTLIP